VRAGKGARTVDFLEACVGAAEVGDRDGLEAPLLASRQKGYCDPGVRCELKGEKGAAHELLV
jgi:hypothetical protein